MLGEKTQELIEEAVKAELQHGIDNYGEFQSFQEAFVVLLEEICELEAEIETTPIQMQLAIELFKDNLFSDEIYGEKILDIYSYAQDVCGEAIQVMAMCDKLLLYGEKRNKQ